jgi:Neuraminidase (sialidase)
MMTRLTTTALLFLLALSTGQFGGLVYSQEPDSFALKSVRIKGQTNVNRFRLTYNAQQAKELSIPGHDMTSGEISFRIPVESFESKNPMLTRDFIRFMQAEEHPYIRVKIRKKQLQALLRDKNDRQLPLRVIMAGETQQASGRYYIQNHTGNGMLIEGSVQLNLEDFNLEPPQKMMGLIQVKDRIFINFDVILSNDQIAYKE